MFKPRFSLIVGLIVAAAATRLVPHPWNFTPIAGIALFSGVYISDRKCSFLVPALALLLGDFILGMHITMPFVYGSFALIVLIGSAIKDRIGAGSVAAAAVGSSVLFFLISNFGYWLVQDFFPKTVSGLVGCYAAALPFFQNTLAGDLLYTALLFGGVHLGVKAFPALREPCRST